MAARRFLFLLFLLNVPLCSPLRLISSLPSGSFVIELSQLEASLETTSVESFFSTSPVDRKLDGKLKDAGTSFITATIIDTKIKDAMDARFGSGKSRSCGIVDAGVAAIELLATAQKPGKLNNNGNSYLSLGLANHHVGGYYWGRSLGKGAAAPAQGIGLRSQSLYFRDDNKPDPNLLEIFWPLRRREARTGDADPGNLPLEERVNSNDGKRSEWVDFLREGDQIQFVPSSPVTCLRALMASAPSPGGIEVYGLRRAGRPRGSEPVVECTWAVCARKDGRLCWDCNY